MVDFSLHGLLPRSLYRRHDASTENAGRERPGLLTLTDDLLAGVLVLLSARDLCAAELACVRFRSICVHLRLWALAAEREASGFLSLKKLGSHSDGSANAEEACINSRIAKRFCGLTLRGVDVGLLSSVVECSSYDNASEGPDNTLTPTLGIRPERITYWSSKGSPDVNSSEFISYRTISDVALLREIVIQPYAAWFQMDYPVYAPRRVRVRVIPNESTRSFDDPLAPDSVDTPASRGERVFDVDSTPLPQSFRIHPPLICEGLLRVELEGRCRVQEVDGLYYTCLSYVAAIGVPISRLITTQGAATLEHPRRGLILPAE